MKNLKVSIIMSAYNSENTIDTAIQSVLEQTYDNYELIIVNDCSTDGTLDKIKKYKSDKVILINHEFNMGCGCSRKTGIENSTGDYICFLDSDDYYDERYVETLINYAIQYNADSIQSGRIIIKHGEFIEKIPEFYDISGPDKLIIEPSENYKFLNSAMFKKELFDKVEYSENRYNEDGPTITKLNMICNRRIFIPYAGYYYNNDNANSLTKNSDNIKNIIYHSLGVFDVIDFANNNNIKYDWNQLVIHTLNNLKNIEYTQDVIQKYKNELLRLYLYIIKLNI